ncbi:MAG: hypothetical protein K5764_03060 [Prevotella sp.]|nr:hypothetical protein [Prevotella sp.]
MASARLAKAISASELHANGHDKSLFFSSSINLQPHRSERLAKEFRLPFELHPAKWRLLGKAAGMVRNAEMAKCSDELIAFWDGESRGTKHMINFARKRGLEVSVIDTTLKNWIDNNSQTTERNTIVAPDEEKMAIKCCHR